MRKNRLGDEKSPYLKQHQHNPVHWQPWDDQAFAAAQAENKPVFLSIGYATCHWCHVMEGDSFEDHEVANVLNEGFIPIKVDREERPDVDAIYMGAVQALTGQGGWPLSVMLTPDRKPFWGGTFLPKPQFLYVLREIRKAWESNRRLDLVKASEDVTAHIAAQLPVTSSRDFSRADVKRLLNVLSEEFDEEDGGFGNAPKFPAALLMTTLMKMHHYSGEKAAATMVHTTLEAMARGGIFDHVGGGFHRYATDRRWLVPHFEKMLYDNALLLSAYADAYQWSGLDLYRDIVTRTANYVLRDLTHPLGGFCSAEDADSEKTEGLFYVWTKKELQSVLSADEYAWLELRFTITDRGNFHISPQVEELERAAGLKSPVDANILALKKEAPWVRAQEPVYQAILEKLFTVRERRTRPLRDGKILAGWNGLMIAGLAKAFRTTGDETMLNAARRAADFVLTHMLKDGDLYRRYCDGDLQVRAMSEDYAFLIRGLLELYGSDFDERWALAARALQLRQDTYFWDDAEGGYFETDGRDASLLHRTKDPFDEAVPSSTGVASGNLQRLSALFMEPALRDKAARARAYGAAFFARFPRALSSTLNAWFAVEDGEKELVVIAPPGRGGEAKQAALGVLREHFIPDLAVAVSEGASALPIFVGKKAVEALPTYYVCEAGRCLAPTTDAEKVWKTWVSPLKNQ